MEDDKEREFGIKDTQICNRTKFTHIYTDQVGLQQFHIKIVNLINLKKILRGFHLPP